VFGQLAKFGGVSAWKCSWCGCRRHGRLGDRMRAYVCDYVLIVARIMFITHVKL
jgi:hypothetical protein